MKKMGGGGKAMRTMTAGKGQKPPQMAGQVKVKSGKKNGSRARFIEEHYGDVPIG